MVSFVHDLEENKLKSVDDMGMFWWNVCYNWMCTNVRSNKFIRVYLDGKLRLCVLNKSSTFSHGLVIRCHCKFSVRPIILSFV